jgi:prevent-host-death family protein
MRIWTLEKAKNAFSEVVRRALAHKPQTVVRGGREEEAVVVVSKADYDRLVAPPKEPLVEFLRRSPLAQAVADGAFGEEDSDGAELFPRPTERARDITLR